MGLGQNLLNTPTLLSGAFVPVTQKPAASYIPITLDNSTISPGGGNAAKFLAFGAAAVANAGDAGRPDVITAWGYNANAGGGKYDASQVAWHYGLEDYYAPGGNAVCESYIQYLGPTGTKRRPWYVNVDLVTENAQTDFYSDTVKWFNGAAASGGGTLAMQLSTNATIGNALLTVIAPAWLAGPSAGNGVGIGGGALTNQGELHVSRAGGGAVTAWDYQITFNHYQSGWGANATRPWLQKSYTAGYGNYLYLGATSNASNSGEPALIMGDSGTTPGIWFGTGKDTGDGLTATWGGFTNYGSFIVGSAALATTATDGFSYIPSMAGAPTGAATAHGSTVPLVIDTTNSKLWARIGGTWKGVALA